MSARRRRPPPPIAPAAHPSSRTLVYIWQLYKNICVSVVQFSRLSIVLRCKCASWADLSWAAAESHLSACQALTLCGLLYLVGYVRIVSVYIRFI